jgi:endonuclease/exonuclease/phosphatase family metal-dependent hydrolase
MRVLTWNLFHGRAVPGRGRDLSAEFATAIAAWDWDVALLQEVPPWYPARLGAASGASARSVRTSRGWIAPLRGLARVAPDVVKSWGGGANAILVRRGGIAEHRAAVLRLRPERRVVHGVRLADGTWVCNVHAQVRPPLAARNDIATAGRLALGWAGSDARVLLGGDFNVTDPAVSGLQRMGGSGVDLVLARGFAHPVRTMPDRQGLSDHAPVLLELQELRLRRSVVGCP